ncbi:MAG: UDP-N-acetylmuramoyl-tripeptide--D-alanyl-D-alanine ligase, partial [Firmicutes bacterium]|nr:UDP-N-acetylmuramoyl-tripeptide--D-alanyl-D-alanine ligase [Bacillota bacterium]
LVDDPLAALAALARAWRRRVGARVVGITGSNGKTSTKDMIATALAVRLRVHRTDGNLNGQIGVPLTLLACPHDAQVIVLEMGISVPGEMARLCAIAAPDIAVITMIGEAHLAQFGTVERIAAEKWGIVQALPPGGLAVLPYDCPPLAGRSLPVGVRVRTFGEDLGADVRMTAYEQTATGARALLPDAGMELILPVAGRHLATNALAALVVADELGVVRAEAVAALRRLQLTGARMAMMRDDRGRIWINDAYNSAPASVLAALAVLRDLPVGRRIAVLGDMLELGEESVRMHEQIGRAAALAGVDDLLSIGVYAVHVASGASAPQAQVAVSIAADVDDARPQLERLLAAADGNCAVLVKGSRKLALERLVAAFVGEPGRRGASG